MSTQILGNNAPVSEARRSRVSLAVLLACPLLVVATSHSAFAQSTGTTAAEELQEIVVTGRRMGQIGAVTEQNAAKSRVTITGEFLQNYIPGQTFLESLNQVPGVSFTNNDPYGSSGGNLREMQDKRGMFAGNAPQIAEQYRTGIQRIPRALLALDVPAIAAVNGPAIGAGCDLAMMCDIRLAAEDAVFAESFVKLGLISGDGGSWYLPRAVGTSRAYEMTLTGEIGRAHV